MGRRRRSKDDLTGGAFEDVADIVSAAADALRTRESEAAAARRRAEREEKRRQWELRQRRNLLGAGAGLLAGGLAASLGLITVGAVGVGLLVGGGVAYAMKALDERPTQPRQLPQSRRPDLPNPSVQGEDPRSALVRGVVTTAMGHIRMVDRCAQESRDLETAAILTRIAAIGARVCQQVADQPAAFDPAQRLLTYHAEKAAQLASMAIQQETEADGARLSDVRRVLSRMETLFEETENALKAGDRKEMDLELRLIDQALDEDLRRDRP